jgi:hypothetical protein
MADPTDKICFYGEDCLDEFLKLILHDKKFKDTTFLARKASPSSACPRAIPISASGRIWSTAALCSRAPYKSTGRQSKIVLTWLLDKQEELRGWIHLHPTRT